MLIPLFALAMMFLPGNKPAPLPYADGVLVSQGAVKTGDMDCETNDSHTHCTPATIWVYRFRFGNEELPLKDSGTKKGSVLSYATGGASDRVRRKSVLWMRTDGEHFEYRTEGQKLRIRKDGRESLYEIYLGR